MADTVQAYVDPAGLDGTGAQAEMEAALHWLDRRLARAIAATGQMPEAAHPYRGLYISAEDVAALLHRAPGQSPFAPEPALDLPDLDAPDSRLGWLGQIFGLSSLELAILVIALAPELDLRYERLYAYLQDDVTRRRPTVELALNLLCADAETKWAARGAVAADAPLRRQQLVTLVADGPQPLTAQLLRADEQIVRFVLGQSALDARLLGCCALIEADAADPPLAAAPDAGLCALIAQAWDAGEALQIYLHGPRGAGKRRFAAALARAVGLPLLAVDLLAVAQAAPDGALLPLIVRDARLLGALLYLDGLEALRDDDRRGLAAQVEAALAADPSVHLLGGTRPWVPSAHGLQGVVAVALPLPDYAARRRCWQAALEQAGLALDALVVDAVAGRFRLTPAQIADAALTVRQTARQLSGGADLPALLFAAARAQSGHDLGALARKIVPVYTWADLVLPAPALTQLRDLCLRVVHRQRVLHEWRFGERLSLGRGVNALFAGPSGTGKTMAAEVIANELGLDLYKIDLSGVVSKYIGETEKNLDRIFTAAENANAILFFDEADALFGKRSEVRDSHDRYANLEIAYLLQKMEQYEGIAILATNLRENMDDAFIRRLHFIVEFPFPDEAQRRAIWQVLLPEDAPRAAAIDWTFLGRQFRLAGGNIRNIVLSAAFLAAADGGRIEMAHLVRATADEYHKLGRVLSADDLGPYAAAVRGA